MMSGQGDESSPLELWVGERFQDALEMRFRVTRTLYGADSPYQRVDVVATRGHGRMLFNDGKAMVSERDEFVYHEMIAHVPLFVLPRVRRVLVIGGGDGGTVREVLRHPGVEYVRLVEIDAAVVEACREHLPLTAGALGDRRVEVAIEDGVAYVARTEDRYDLVLVDSTDPIGPAAPLFGGKFYDDVRRLLTDHGAVVSQAESPFYELAAQAALVELLAERFRRVAVYNYTNLTYPGGLWSFSFASRGDLCPTGDFDPRRVAVSGLDFRWYSPAVHLAAFAHPRFQAERLARWLTPPKRDPLASPAAP
jgi:spermidine synthase